MIQIYGSPQSSAGRCYWTLEEAGVPYERVAVSFRDREHKAPAFLRLNPNGKVPVLVDGDLVLWESIAINRYLAEKHQPALLGTGAAERALVDQWSVWSQVDFQPPVIALFIQLVFVPEERRDPAAMDAARAKIGPLVALLNTHLEGRAYMVGAQFTLADLNVASVAKLLASLAIDLGAAPNLTTWLARTQARDAVARVAALT